MTPRFKVTTVDPASTSTLTTSSLRDEAIRVTYAIIAGAWKAQVENARMFYSEPAMYWAMA